MVTARYCLRTLTQKLGIGTVSLFYTITLSFLLVINGLTAANPITHRENPNQKVKFQNVTHLNSESLLLGVAVSPKRNTTISLRVPHEIAENLSSSEVLSRNFKQDEDLDSPLTSPPIDITKRWFPKHRNNFGNGPRKLTWDSRISKWRQAGIELPSFAEVGALTAGDNQDKDSSESNIKSRVRRSWMYTLVDLWNTPQESFDDLNMLLCDHSPCPSWSEWHGSGSCNTTCGGGSQLLVRYCKDARNDEFQGGCEGDSTKLQRCNSQPCPEWSPWQPTGECSVTCGQGIVKYIRKCMLNNSIANDCIGSGTEYRFCTKNESCPAQWTTWSHFGPCTRTCGVGGYQLRRRICLASGVRIDNGPETCQGHASQQRQCQVQHVCPPNYSDWGSWSRCDTVTCGQHGSQSRTRKCLASDGSKITKNEANCKKDQLKEVKKCQSEPCASACNLIVSVKTTTPAAVTPTPTWSQWTGWNDCSVTCGDGGHQTRTRLCFGVSFNGENNSIVLNQDKSCEGASLESRSCYYDVSCPRWDSWMHWGACTKSCGFGGKKSRQRRCIVETYNNANSSNVVEMTTHSMETLKYDMGDGGSGELSTEKENENGSMSSVPIGTLHIGTPQHSKKGIVLLSNDICLGGVNNSIMFGTCNEHFCPPKWSSWESWSECSVTCGTGQNQRTRKCIGHGACHGTHYEFQTCYKPPCWSNWSQFSPCSKSCGNGTKTRARKCRGETEHIVEYRECVGEKEEAVSCNPDECPVWGYWSEWGKCSKTCGGGNKVRRRICLHGDCRGLDIEDMSCSYKPCPYWGGWTAFSCCSVTCGKGHKTRSRICRHGKPGQGGCLGTTSDAQVCTHKACNETVVPSLSSTQCGVKPAKSTPKAAILRIFGGKISQDHEWPWQVSWQHLTCSWRDKDCEWEHLCGATLLSPEWVITAGHCIEEGSLTRTPGMTKCDVRTLGFAVGHCPRFLYNDPQKVTYRVFHGNPGEKWSVVVGMTQLNVDGDRYFLKRIHLHPDYEYVGVTRNDIALMRLMNPVVITEHAMPACLPETSIPGNGEHCFITGWGNLSPYTFLSKNLREASIPILGFSDCQKIGNDYRTYLNSQYHMCAGNAATAEADSCRGDSGGPMVCVRPDGKWYLAGITSFGFEDCGQKGHVGIYTPVNNYEKWIRDIVDEYSRC